MLRRLVWLVALALLWAGAANAQGDGGVSAERFARLAKGINLPYWFWYAPEDPAARFNEADFSLLRDLGFTHVRVPIDLGFIYDPASPDQLNQARLAHIDAGLDALLAHDLAVIVDLHSTSLEDSNNAVYSGRLEDDATFIDTFEAFWRAFAAHLSARDPDMVFLEVMNEPVFQDDPSRWPPIQARLLAAVREAAPEHTLIATGALWSSLDTLLQLEPLDDPNVVYNFHFYEPFLFTHQGATWTWEAVRFMRDVPYPSSPQAVESARVLASDPQIRQYLDWYGAERWDATRIDGRIALAAAWAQDHGVRVICDEFGAYAAYAPADDRAQWIYDVRASFERHDIGWAMWEYDGGFGLALRVTNRVIVLRPIAEALGLTLP